LVHAHNALAQQFIPGVDYFKIVLLLIVLFLPSPHIFGEAI
jgi:hypothetical protein